MKDAETISFTERSGELRFSVRVVPRAARSAPAGVHAGSLKLRLAAPPVDGAANEELIRVLARLFGVATRDVEIASGHHARLKQVRVRGGTAEILKRLVESE